jgi:hypothetical protein
VKWNSTKHHKEEEFQNYNGAKIIWVHYPARHA